LIKPDAKKWRQSCRRYEIFAAVHARRQAAPQGNTYNANITNNQARDEGGTGRDALAVWKNQGPRM
jgi:hypothetical protein